MMTRSLLRRQQAFALQAKQGFMRLPRSAARI